jgi:phospholipid/cholesterol/gamma-HCH transport system substrate-binding protein
VTDCRLVRRVLALSCSVILTATACGFEGLNSLPLPGAVGRGSGSATYHVEIANVATLESNSPVMINDVAVGSVGKMTFTDWHVDVALAVRPDVVVPANAVARIGQTSLLGSMHLSLDPPLGQAPQGRLEPGSTIELNNSSTYPSTELTLSALSTVVNTGGLGQIGDVVHNFNAALSGHEPQIRDLLTRLDNFVGTLERQRANILATIDALDRLAGTLAGQRDVIDAALHKIPPALDVLIRERPRITTALDKLRVFSGTATQLVTDTQTDLVANLQHLAPTLGALADVGPTLDQGLAYATAFPYGQDTIDRGVKGDYINEFAIVDATIPRLKRSLFLGTRWGQPNEPLVPAPGEPAFLNYNYGPGNKLPAIVPPASPPQGTGSPPVLPVPPQIPPAQASAPLPDFAPLDEGGH